MIQIQPAYTIYDKEINVVILPLVYTDDVKELYRRLKPGTIVLQQFLYNKGPITLRWSAENISEINFPMENIYLLCDLKRQMEWAKEVGYKNCILCNANLCVDVPACRVIPCTEKIYRAFMVARFQKYKRHYLASEVQNLALCGKEKAYFPKDAVSVEDVKEKLTGLKFLGLDIPHVEVIKKYNESYTSLCLSDMEGACESSLESLLCGCPVVSTKNEGGRDFWLNSSNSLYCEDDPRDVESKVEQMVIARRRGEYCANKIREDALTLYRSQCQVFIDLLKKIGVKDMELLKKIDNNPSPYFRLVFRAVLGLNGSLDTVLV